MTKLSKVFDISSRYVEEMALLDPDTAMRQGTGGGEGDVTDYSPDGAAARTEARARHRQHMADATPADDADRRARHYLLERVEAYLAHDEHHDAWRDLAVTGSPLQRIRTAFDLLPRETTEHWERVAQRMAGVPGALQGLAASLRQRNDQGHPVARRQVQGCIAQARSWAGTRVPVGAPAAYRYFGGMADEYARRSTAKHKLAETLRKASVRADMAYDGFADFLADEYLAMAPLDDAVGEERYLRAARSSLGTDVDLRETYAWGWDELHRIDADVRAVCKEILPGASLREVIERLDADHDRCIHGPDALRDWLQALVDRTITLLDGPHFDVPEPVRRLDVRIAPAGGTAARYYTPPAEGFRRPGIYWFPVAGRSRFPVWSEISTAYHEGVPGHHLQVGMARSQGDALSRLQQCTGVPGYSEGWALYAEGLMDELGLLDRPQYRLDMLLNRLYRASRVVIDIGLHLGLAIPSTSPFHPGERWTPDLAAAFLLATSNLTPAMVSSEIDRYLGVPGQALAYKVGERVWREARSDAEHRRGADFDRKAFHMHALRMGPMGLDQLRSELANV